MIIGVLGKGGSGKSTVSTNLVKFLASKKEHTVLAIDADHNMDITYNLGVTEEFPYLGGSMSDLKHITARHWEAMSRDCSRFLPKIHLQKSTPNRSLTISQS
jgi:CO dehydrogenase nickel-insertion accessory protein CooC1